MLTFKVSLVIICGKSELVKCLCESEVRKCLDIVKHRVGRGKLRSFYLDGKCIYNIVNSHNVQYNEGLFNGAFSDSIDLSSANLKADFLVTGVELNYVGICGIVKNEFVGYASVIYNVAYGIDILIKGCNIRITVLLFGIIGNTRISDNIVKSFFDIKL